MAFDVLHDDIKSAVRELVAAEGRTGVDLVYDPVGGDQAETWLRALGDDGQFLVIGFVGGVPSIPLNHVLLRNRSVVGVEWGSWALHHRTDNDALQREVMEMIAAGTLDPVEPTAYSLERTVDALRDLAERRASGKLIVVP